MTENLQPEGPKLAASTSLVLVISWLWVGVPLAWGVWRTLQTSLALFE